MDKEKLLRKGERLNPSRTMRSFGMNAAAAARRSAKREGGGRGGRGEGLVCVPTWTTIMGETDGC